LRNGQRKQAKLEVHAQTAKPRDGNRPANGAVLAAVSESSTTTSTELNEESAVDSCRSLVPTTSPSTSSSSPDYEQVGTTGDISDRCDGAINLPHYTQRDLRLGHYSLCTFKTICAVFRHLKTTTHEAL